jgi:hypothetical protein
MGFSPFVGLNGISNIVFLNCVRLENYHIKIKQEDGIQTITAPPGGVKMCLS